MSVSKTHHSHRGTYSKVIMCQISRLLLWKSPQECQNVTIEFCFIVRISYELRCAVIIEILWTFYLKSVPAKFQKYLKHVSWVISGTSLSKLSCNPRHPSRNISCNHRHHLLQPSWRRIFSTSNNQKTRIDSHINGGYKASSFDKLYIRRKKNETQRALLGHTNGNIEMRSPSAAAMLTGRAVPPSDLEHLMSVLQMPWCWIFALQRRHMGIMAKTPATVCSRACWD